MFYSIYGASDRITHSLILGTTSHDQVTWFSLAGAPAMTSRGLVEKDFEQIAEFLHRAVTVTLNIQKEYGKLLKDFNKGLVNNKEIEELKADVEKFSSSFDMPGFKMSEMKYQ